MQVAVLIKLATLITVCVLLTGCAHYDWSFNKAQLALDEVRHVRSKLEQGQLP